MKKLKSLGVVAAATILLTSCLDGNNESSLNGFGVIDYSDDFRMVAYIDDYTPVYSPVFKDEWIDIIISRNRYRNFLLYNKVRHFPSIKCVQK